jgi:hypothetical protein
MVSVCGLLKFLVECSDAGNWLFCGRRWMDPADPDGRITLDLHYHNLCALFPAFAAACSNDRFIGAVTAVIDSWSRHAAAADAESDPPSAGTGTASEDAADGGRPQRPARTAQAGDGIIET